VPVAGPDASPEALEAIEEARRAAEEADRVRAEAEARATRESVAAVRTAEETVHRIRSEVLARVESVAPPADGSSPPEGAAAAAAAAAAEQAEAEAAERRAALEARKARELAHRRARAEAAEADQRARDAASRAAALVARPVAAPDPTITLDRATGLAATPASPGVRPQSAPAVAPGAAAVHAVRPGAERAPAVVAAQAAAPEGPLLRSGEIPCPDCGEGNETTRRFCRRCGRPTLDDAVPAGPRLRWWQRLLRWLHLRREPSTRTSREWTEQPAQGTGAGARLKAAVQSVTSMAKMIAVVVVVLGLGLSLGPLRSQVTDRIDSVRRAVAPRPRPVKNVAATSSQPRAADLVNTFKNTPPWVGPSGATVDFTFPEKVDLFKIGIEADDSNAPGRLVLAVSGGKPRTCTLNFTGTSGFESFTCKVKSAQSAVLTVFGAPGQSTTTLTQVEFFEVS